MSNGTLLRYGVGSVVANEGDVLSLPKNWRADNTGRGIITCHGAGGNAWNSGWNYNPQLVDAYANLAMDNGQTGVTPDGMDEWANPTHMSRVTSGAAYLQGAPVQAKTDKIFLIGFSMGAHAALVWAAHNPTKVAGIWAGIPAIGMQDIWSNNRSGLRTEINTAYGFASGNTTFLNNGVTADPVYAGGAALGNGHIDQERDVSLLAAVNPAVFANIPIVMFYGAKYVGYATPVSPQAITAASVVGTPTATTIRITCAAMVGTSGAPLLINGHRVSLIGLLGGTWANANSTIPITVSNVNYSTGQFDCDPGVAVSGTYTASSGAVAVGDPTAIPSITEAFAANVNAYCAAHSLPNAVTLYPAYGGNHYSSVGDDYSHYADVTAMFAAHA